MYERYIKWAKQAGEDGSDTSMQAWRCFLLMSAVREVVAMTRTSW